MTLFECSKSPLEPLRESAFNIIAAVPDLIANQSPEAIRGVFVTALQDASLKVLSIPAIQRN